MLAEEKVRKHLIRVTGAWKQTSKQRRQVDVSYDLRTVTALQHSTWMDEERLKRTCIKKKGKRASIHTTVSKKLKSNNNQALLKAVKR